jgi:hypothetical protein
VLRSRWDERLRKLGCQYEPSTSADSYFGCGSCYGYSWVERDAYLDVEQRGFGFHQQ